MGFFAVLRSKQSPTPFDVVHCHLNLWVLGGIFGHRNFFFDVGLRIKARNEEVRELELALPFRANEQAFRDLRDTLKSPANRQLIFGRPVDSRQPSPGVLTINYDGSELSVLNVIEPEFGHQRSRDFCTVRLRLSPGIALDQEAYLRVRFHALRIGRTWTWKRYLLVGKNGAVTDFRVADARDAIYLNDVDTLIQRMTSIEKLYLFLICPATFQQRALFPDPHYVRLFEGRAWEEYLDSVAYCRRSMRLLIYQWRGNNISPDKPFRAFGDFSRDFGVASVAHHAVTAIAVVIALVATIWIFYEAPLPAIAPSLGGLVASLVGVGVLGVLSYLKLVRKAAAALRTGFFRFEQWLMRALRPAPF